LGGGASIGGGVVVFDLDFGEVGEAARILVFSVEKREARLDMMGVEGWVDCVGVGVGEGC
jgi:hypothetical protein